MVKTMSKSRKDYFRAYRLIREKGSSGYIQFLYGEPDEVQDCALLSYDYHDSEFSGWINRQRMSRFIERSRGNYHSVYGIPF
jgi:hypothetical protein